MNIEDFGDENVGWPSYVDFLSTFSFILFIFIGSLLFILYGQLPERLWQIRVAPFVKQMGAIGIPVMVEGMRIRWDLRNQLDFATGSSNLSNEHKAYLKRVARQLPAALKVAGDCRVIVSGTADSKQYPNDPFGNWALSAKRALNVLEFLHECPDCGYGVEIRKKMVLFGEGDTRANQVKAMVEDRRVDLIIDCTKDASLLR
jgi:flagellar motor protein MotB